MDNRDHTRAAGRPAAHRQPFTDGYQEALRDIRAALDDGGTDAVQKWLDDNIKPTWRDDFDVTVTRAALSTAGMPPEHIIGWNGTGDRTVCSCGEWQSPRVGNKTAGNMHAKRHLADVKEAWAIAGEHIATIKPE